MDNSTKEIKANLISLGNVLVYYKILNCLYFLQVLLNFELFLREFLNFFLNLGLLCSRVVRLFGPGYPRLD